MECNRDEWMLRMRRMGSCPCKQPGRPIARFHSNPSGKCLAGRSAALRRLPIAGLLAAHRALHPIPARDLCNAKKTLKRFSALVRKLILAGTGPAGGEGISAVAGVANVDLLRGFFTGQDPKQFLFFTRTPNGIEAGKTFLQRLSERSGHRDKDITLRAYVAQLQALNAWGKKAPADLSYIHQPVLMVNGDSDRMVPTRNSLDLAHRLPNSTLVIYPDAGHGGVFQFHTRFVSQALEFLAR